MTPKEKAFELAHKFRLLEIRTGQNSHMMISMECAKHCALIAVDEILEFMEADDFDSDTCYWANHSKMQYFEQVKQEIQNL
jgi:hypothetical protein